MKHERDLCYTVAVWLGLGLGLGFEFHTQIDITSPNPSLTDFSFFTLIQALHLL